MKQSGSQVEGPFGSRTHSNPQDRIHRHADEAPGFALRLRRNLILARAPPHPRNTLPGMPCNFRARYLAAAIAYLTLTPQNFDMGAGYR